MVIRRLHQKHYEFISADSPDGQRSTASPEREAIEAEIQVRAYQLWFQRGVGKGSTELDWLIDGRLMHDLARLSYPKLLSIDGLLARRLSEAIGSRISASPREMRRSSLVIVVDDEPAIRDFVRYALEGQGFSVLIASDAEGALQLLETYRGQVPLVITDIQMPGVGGDTLADCIRGEHPETHILLMSGMAAEEIPARWRGADPKAVWARPPAHACEGSARHYRPLKRPKYPRRGCSVEAGSRESTGLRCGPRALL